MVIFLGRAIFPARPCESVKVIYLEPSECSGKTVAKLFEVSEENQLIKSRADIEKDCFTYKESNKIVAGDILKRFKFGEENYQKYCVSFQEAVPIGPQGEISKSIGANSGVGLIKNYVSMIYKFGSMFIALVAVLVIVISGIQMTTGGIDPNAFESAKERILAALLSLLLLFSSAMILKTINPGFFT